MQFPITIGLHRSFFLVSMHCVAHVLAATVIFTPSWSAEVKALLLVGVVCFGMMAWRCMQPAADRLRLLDDRCLECGLVGEDVFIPAEVQPGVTVHPWLTVIPLRLPDRRLFVIVSPDAIHPDDFRCLRMWLRLRAEINVGKGAA